MFPTREPLSVDHSNSTSPHSSHDPTPKPVEVVKEKAPEPEPEQKPAEEPAQKAEEIPENWEDLDF